MDRGRGSKRQRATSRLAKRARVLWVVGWILLATAAAADPPPGYYDSVDTTSAATLRETLHEVIDDHTRFRYTSSTQTDTWDILESADQDPEDEDRVLEVYRNESYPKAGGGNANYNREHSWPKSYGFRRDLVSNYPFTDCHHLFLSHSDYNSSRGNKPYRSCPEGCTEKPTERSSGEGEGPAGEYPGTSNWTGRDAWETWRGRRGDVARALFYMDVRYEGGQHGVTRHPEPDLILTDDPSLIRSSNENESQAHMGLLSDLLAWHREDPPDEKERRRNDVVEGGQGNRNPFIDHPTWAGCVFEDECEGLEEPGEAEEPEPDEPEEPEPTGPGEPDGDAAETIEGLLERIEAIEEDLEEIKTELEELGEEPP